MKTIEERAKEWADNFNLIREAMKYAAGYTGFTADARIERHYLIQCSINLQATAL